MFHDVPTFFIGDPLAVLVKNLRFSPSWAHIPLHKHKLRFFRDLPVFFAGDPLAILVKKLHFSASWAHIPLHKHKLRFSSLFQPFLWGIYPLSVSVKNFYFSPSWAHIPLHKHKLSFSWSSSLSRREHPISFSQNLFFPFMGTYSPS